MIQAIKKILVWFLVIYTFFMICDYTAVWRHGDRESCQRWMNQAPWWVHFAVPGIGNACIDFKYWP